MKCIISPALHGFAAFAMVLCATAQVPQQEVPAVSGATNLTELRQRLSSIVSQAKYASAMWGVKVVTEETGALVFEHNPELLFSPASNSKLYTVALALDTFGDEHRIRTSLYSHSAPETNGVLRGDLVVFGRGDPSLNARLNGGSVFNAMQKLVDAVTNAGISRIEGDLVGDTSFIRGSEFGSGWSWDDQFYYYGAEISALTVNDNLVDVLVKPGARPGEPCTISFDPPTSLIIVSNRTQTVAKDGSRSVNVQRLPSRNMIYVSGHLPLEGAPLREVVTLHNPAELFVELLSAALKQNGVALKGEARTIGWLEKQSAPPQPNEWVEIGAVESLQMRDLAREVQKPSQNLYTDLLLALVGESSRGKSTPSERTSEDLGLAELNRFLSKVGIPRGQVFFEEGSGLSRNNLTTPAATISLLRYMARHKSAEAYIQALPLAGVDGTLRNRMRGTAAAGKVRAKTGTLRWANSLSGYVTSAGGQRLVFCTMLNRFHNADPSSLARADLDAIAVELAAFRGGAE